MSGLVTGPDTPTSPIPRKPRHEHQALPLADGRGLPATILVAAILALGVSHPASPPLRAASDLAKEPKRYMATDFRIDCKTCNIPAKKGRLRVRPGVPAPQETHPAQMKRRASALVGGGPGSLNNSRNSKVLKEFRLKDRSCGFPVP